MIYNKTTWFLSVVFFLLSCKTGDNKDNTITSSGIAINFIKEGSGKALEKGNIVKINLRYETEEGKVILENEANKPLVIQYNRDTSSLNGKFPEVFNVLSVGDSIKFQIEAEDLYLKTFRRPLPDSVKREDMLLFNLGVVEQMSQDEYRQSISKEQNRIDSEIIESYLNDKGIKAIKTESGLEYKIIERGSGPPPKKGQTVNVKYAGRLLDGTPFDSGEIKFVLGQGKVIKGWDEGIGYLNVGAKGSLYIPSSLGYGARGSGPIPPNSILEFDVELLEIIDENQE